MCNVYLMSESGISWPFMSFLLTSDDIVIVACWVESYLPILRPGFVLRRSENERLARWRKWKSCDVVEAKEGLENELRRRWSNGRIGEWAVTYVKRRKGWRMSYDVGEAKERFENELCVCVCVYVQSCVVSDCSPDILLTRNSRKPALVYVSIVLVHNKCSPTGIWTTGFWVVNPGGVSPRLGKGK